MERRSTLYRAFTPPHFGHYHGGHVRGRELEARRQAALRRGPYRALRMQSRVSPTPYERPTLVARCNMCAEIAMDGSIHPRPSEYRRSQFTLPPHHLTVQTPEISERIHSPLGARLSSIRRLLPASIRTAAAPSNYRRRRVLALWTAIDRTVDCSIRTKCPTNMGQEPLQRRVSCRQHCVSFCMGIHKHRTCC